MPSEGPLPGDVILFHRIVSTTDPVPASIEAAQRIAGFSAEDARWTHAGIFAGEFQIIEALRHGVVKSPILPTLSDFAVRVRRFPDLDTSTRAQIAREAEKALGKPYDFFGAMGQIAKLFPGWKSGGMTPNQMRKTFICTSLCQQAYWNVVKVDIFRVFVSASG